MKIPIQMFQQLIGDVDPLIAIQYISRLGSSDDEIESMLFPIFPGGRVDLVEDTLGHLLVILLGLAVEVMRIFLKARLLTLELLLPLL